MITEMVAAPAAWEDGNELEWLTAAELAGAGLPPLGPAAALPDQSMSGQRNQALWIPLQTELAAGVSDNKPTWRCLHSDHGPQCTECVAPPSAGDEELYELVGDQARA